MQGRRAQAVKATLLVAAARLLLRRYSTSAVLSLLARPPRRAVAAPADLAGALDAVRLAGGRLRATCLQQSVALAALLTRRGAEPEVVLGCRRHEENDWGAHAWVEVGDQRLEPVEEPAHTALARLRACAGWSIEATPRS